MGNMLTATITVRGTRPLFWHRFGPDALPLEKQEKTGVAGNDPEEWRKTVLKTTEGQLYLEPTYAFGCIRDGAKHTKKGKGNIQSLVTATLQVLDDKILIDRFLPDTITTDDTEPVYLDVRMVRNPSTRARNVRYRVAAKTGWTCSFTVIWDATIVSRGEMQAVIIDAGRLVGLGDGRSIGFGRFSVESFEIHDDQKSA